jgi:hypothetical protein
MRWIVEVSPLRPSLAPGEAIPPDQYVVEAKSWQQALQAARESSGSNGPISQISIELLPEGYRAVDPVGRLRYVIKRAGEDTPLTSPGRYSQRPTAPGSQGAPATEVTGVPARPRTTPPAPKSVPPPPKSVPPAPRSNPPDASGPSSTRIPKAATIALDQAAAQQPPAPPTSATANVVPSHASSEAPTRSPVALSVASPPMPP